jgi:DNA-binding CsgD family transcriptional regulator
MELLEREAFRATLAEYAREARAGDGRLILISGESGMGKTALLEAFERDLPDARWLWGSCDALLTPRPLGPLFDIGAQLDGDLADLCRQGADRDGLFAAFLAEIGDPGAFTVAVIEDAHWADEATIDLLSFAGRRLARMSALVLVTFRDDELGDDHPLRLVLGDLATQRGTRRMRLPPLSEEAVRTLASGRRDVDAAELHRVTAGNPFYVGEVLDTGWPAVPPTVRDMVGARLVRSSSEARRAVEFAAVIGTRVDRNLLTAVLESSDAAAAECLSTGILLPDGDDLRFRHELVRMAVEEGIAPHRKRELHARLLKEMEATGRADPALLAHHADGAGNEAAVLRHAADAARRSSALGAHREAAAQFERALWFGDGLMAHDRAGLYESAAGEYALLDRWHEAERALRLALDLRRAAHDDVHAGEDLRRLAVTLWRLCRGKESEEAAREAVTVLSALPAGPELAWAYATNGVMLPPGQVQERLDFLSLARDLGERQHQPDVVSYALNAIGLNETESGGDGTATLEQALRLALNANLQEAAGRAYTSLQESFISLHRFDLAEHYYHEGMSYCDDRELGVFTYCLTGARSVALTLLGQWDEAVDIGNRLLARPGVSPVNRLNALTAIGSISGRRGQADGWDLLDEVLQIAEGTADPCWVVPVRAARAELRWLAGEPGLAADEALAVRDVIEQADPYATWSLAIWLWRLGLDARLPSEPPEPYALEMSGGWQQAATAWERLGRPYDAALVRVIHGDEAALRDALAVFDGLGARTAAAAARRRMHELGVRAIPRGPRPATQSAPAGLTAREQEVLALIAQGLPDKEISRKLFISERTVQHHVSAVLSKIGVASRTAAAAEAARLGIGAPA